MHRRPRGVEPNIRQAQASQELRPPNSRTPSLGEAGFLKRKSVLRSPEGTIGPSKRNAYLPVRLELMGATVGLSNRVFRTAGQVRHGESACVRTSSGTQPVNPELMDPYFPCAFFCTFAHVSRSVTVRLTTKFSGVVSASTQK